MFTNVLLAMLVMTFSDKSLRIEADYQVNEEICISALEWGCSGEHGVNVRLTEMTRKGTA